MMTTLNNRVSALFADPLQAVFREAGLAPLNVHSLSTFAPVCIWEDADTIYVEMDLPGVLIDDMNVDIEKGLLSIKACRKAPAQGAHYDERRFGDFERRIRLDDCVTSENVDAHVENGVLQIRLMKNVSAKKQSIPIKQAAPNGKRLESESK